LVQLHWPAVSAPKSATPLSGTVVSATPVSRTSRAARADLLQDVKRLLGKGRDDHLFQMRELA
jgi:hypothetical protein